MQAPEELQMSDTSPRDFTAVREHSDTGATGWEAKVLERLKERVEELNSMALRSRDLGWEADSFEVLKSHVRSTSVGQI
jgi:hypothetical protein